MQSGCNSGISKHEVRLAAMSQRLDCNSPCEPRGPIVWKHNGSKVTIAPHAVRFAGVYSLMLRVKAPSHWLSSLIRLRWKNAAGSSSDDIHKLFLGIKVTWSILAIAVIAWPLFSSPLLVYWIWGKVASCYIMVRHLKTVKDSFSLDLVLLHEACQCCMIWHAARDVSHFCSNGQTTFWRPSNTLVDGWMDFIRKRQIQSWLVQILVVLSAVISRNNLQTNDSWLKGADSSHEHFKEVHTHHVFMEENCTESP